MSFWCRIRQSKLKSLSHQFNKTHLQIHCNSFHDLINSDAKTYLLFQNPRLITPKRSSEFCNNSRFFAAPVQVKTKDEEKDKSGPRLNEKITAAMIRLVVPDGEHLVVSRNEALERARKLKLDLVEVQRFADPPVCKLMDYHKEKYIKQIKGKERTKSKSEVALKKGDCKEVRFTVKTEQKDLQIKADTTKRLMERGYRVKCMAMGTEDQDLGGLISRLSKLIEDVCIVESGPRVEKKQAYIVVRHIKFGPSKKSGNAKKPSKVVGAPSTASLSKEASVPNQASLKPEDGLSESESVYSDEDNEDTEPDKYLDRSRDTWSVSDTTDDFDKVFDFSDVKGESTSVPETTFSPANSSITAQPIRELARPNTGSSSSPKLPFQTESRYDPRNRNQPPIPMENNARIKPQFHGQGNLPHPNMNNAPKQEQSSPGTVNRPASSYGIFSSLKTNASVKQGAPEGFNGNRKEIPFVSESNPNRRVSPSSNLPASDSDGRQKQQGEQRGWGIFSKESRDTHSSRTSVKPS